jgi:hypothetical protein
MERDGVLGSAGSVYDVVSCCDFLKTEDRLVLSGMTNNSLAVGLALTALTRGTLGEESARKLE